MSLSNRGQFLEPIALGERILELLGEGSFSATYKYALLISLIELCLEKSEPSVGSPDWVTTRECAEKVIELYWAHTLPYQTATLRQNSRGQAEILQTLLECRAYAAQDASSTIARARRSNPDAWTRLCDRVEWKLIEMPLPRLQVIGNRCDEFLYRIGWDQDVRHRAVQEYQRGAAGAFDNRIFFQPGVSSGLVRLSPLLVPMIHREWTLLVARFNQLEVSRLEDFLFGEARLPLTGTRELLWEIQKGRCYYCDRRLGTSTDVDHFIPWSRYPNNAVENLVVADSRCNHDKRDFLANTEHLERWLERIRSGSQTRSLIASFSTEKGWDHWPNRSRNVAAAIYTGLPEGYSLWNSVKEFVPLNKAQVGSLFRTYP